ncbi:uncharacterized protein [Nicotiana sylvestris]|uniref:uncharacterized protein n=1 Tax=Nicotiana sylvestris TaxID=4096 RepID=UPI00388CC48B
MDPLKYIFQKPMLTGKLTKWKILLSEFDIVYVTQKAVKGQALEDHLAENLVEEAYKPLKTYFPDEEISFVGEDITETYDGQRMFFDRAAISNEWASEQFWYQKRVSIIWYKENKNYIDPIPVRIYNQLKYCAHVEEEANGKPWFHDIKDGGNLYRRTPDLGLLRCVNAKEASKLLEDVHAGTCGPHINGFILAKKILRAGYFWMTMETDCIQYVCKCFQCQVHADMIKVLPNELNATSLPWPFTAWGMNVIDLIKPTTSNRHGFILVAIDYFTKWVEAASYKAKNSTAYRPQMNIAIEDANKNIKMILRKMEENHNQWHKKLPFALLGYRTIVRTSIGETPYMLVYGTEAVILAVVDIPSLKIIQEAELSDVE